MRRYAKIAVGLPAQQLAQLHSIVDSGEFTSPAEVLREALAAWLQRRRLYAGRLGEERLSRSFAARRDPTPPEPAERVALLFDAQDAKA